MSLFYDEKSANSLSDACLYWIGGILKHIRSLCAIICPTTVCYDRLDWNEAYVADWGFNTRFAMISVKGDKQNTYWNFVYLSIGKSLFSLAICCYVLEWMELE
eukprot:TRINITY_DN3289_c0_g1_i1.p1 TRINITY_DN3289_c0_g1~~TRINITY_DN3289_c0_g1_i1.p1  ORF type:complete len:103 (-),score=15.23 TRINITY_DN3289_c0_g1_i1:17-325(-)